MRHNLPAHKLGVHADLCTSIALAGAPDEKLSGLPPLHGFCERYRPVSPTRQSRISDVFIARVNELAAKEGGGAEARSSAVPVGPRREDLSAAGGLRSVVPRRLRGSGCD